MKQYKPFVYIFLAILAVMLIFGKAIKAWFISIFGTNTGFTLFNDASSDMSYEKAKQIADSLEVAMRGVGTDEDTIYSLLGDLSKPDFNKVYNAYGKRNTSNFAFLGRNLDLWQWLNLELSKSEIAELKKLNPSIFE